MVNSKWSLRLNRLIKTSSKVIRIQVLDNLKHRLANILVDIIRTFVIFVLATFS